MTNRKKLTFGLAAGLVALVGTCLVAKEAQQASAEKAKEPAAVADKAKEPATRTQVEASVTTNGNMVTERRRETTTTTDADGNVVATCTSESLQSYPVGETATAGVVAAPGVKAEPVGTDAFLGLKFGDVFKVAKKDLVQDGDEPSLVRAKFKPAKPLAGFDDYFVYLTPKTHKVAMVCACAKKAIEPTDGNWRRHYLIEALEKRYRTWARRLSWTHPYYRFDVAPGRRVTACLAGATDDYEAVITAWDAEVTREADEERAEIAEETRKAAEKSRKKRMQDAFDAF
ncbi:MAG: hypothetical protein J6V72_21710 [Kiritimatiellae bacterium]|nr:hypothetical protein [Kiritimatiellia bacterium]